MQYSILLIQILGLQTHCTPHYVTLCISIEKWVKSRYYHHQHHPRNLEDTNTTPIQNSRHFPPRNLSWNKISNVFFTFFGTEKALPEANYKLLCLKHLSLDKNEYCEHKYHHHFSISFPTLLLCHQAKTILTAKLCKIQSDWNSLKIHVAGWGAVNLLEKATCGTAYTMSYAH